MHLPNILEIVVDDTFAYDTVAYIVQSDPLYQTIKAGSCILGRCEAFVACCGS
jgi:hypothetical protein